MKKQIEKLLICLAEESKECPCGLEDACGHVSEVSE